MPGSSESPGGAQRSAAGPTVPPATPGSSAPPSDAGIGRREAHKRATRIALQEAADRLFAERGVLATTVRDIAEAAGVTERTFFRYFRSKEELVIKDSFSWMPIFTQLVLARPATEPPLLAIRRTLALVMTAITRTDRPSPFALWADAAPADRVGGTARTIMLKLEADLADVIERRLAATSPRESGRSTIDPRYRAEVLARESVAAFRSAMLRDLQLRRDHVENRPTLADLLDQAYESLEAAQPPSGTAEHG